ASLFAYCLLFFFFSSRRRHTRFSRDWSSDVCSSDPAAAQRAYLAGLQRVLPRDHLPYAPPANGALALDEVWPALDALEPLAKQLMVEAVTAAASHDGRISVAESELLRTICGVLHCPLPPGLEAVG